VREAARRDLRGGRLATAVPTATFGGAHGLQRTNCLSDVLFNFARCVAEDFGLVPRAPATPRHSS
jgi:hypothetical protein